MVSEAHRLFYMRRQREERATVQGLMGSIQVHLMGKDENRADMGTKHTVRTDASKLLWRLRGKQGLVSGGGVSRCAVASPAGKEHKLNQVEQERNNKAECLSLY